MRPLIATLLGLLCAAAVSVAQPPPLPAPPGGPEMPGTVRPAAQQFKDLVPALIDALKDTDPDVRQHAALALAAAGRDALKPLIDALKDAAAVRRAGAAYALGQMGVIARDAIPELLKALKDEEATVRRAAAQAVSRIVNSESQIGLGVPGGMPAFRFAPALPTPDLPKPEPEKAEKAK